MDLGKLSKLSEHRKCVTCGEEFHSDKELSAMQKHTDHLVVHQPSGEQWTNAYNLIRKGKEAQKL